MSNSAIPDKTASWLAYVGSFVTGIIVLALSGTQSKLVKTHAWLSIWLALVSVGLFLVFTWLSWLPVVGIMFGMVRWFMITLWFVLTLACIISATEGKVLKLPGITPLAEKSAGK